MQYPESSITPQSEARREVVGGIFDRVQALIKGHGELSTFGERYFGERDLQEVVYLDFPTRQDARNHHRIIVCGNPESERVVIFYNKHFKDGARLDVIVTLTKQEVINFRAQVSEWRGKNVDLITNPAWRPRPSAYGDLDDSLSEIDIFLRESLVVSKTKTDTQEDRKSVIGKFIGWISPKRR